MSTSRHMLLTPCGGYDAGVLAWFINNKTDIDCLGRMWPSV